MIFNKFAFMKRKSKKQNFKALQRLKKEARDNGVTIIKNIGFTREGYKNHHYIGVIELFPT